MRKILPRRLDGRYMDITMRSICNILVNSDNKINNGGINGIYNKI